MLTIHRPQQSSTKQSITRLLPETWAEQHPLPSGIPPAGRLVVTISRQCGSGGSEVGRILARQGQLYLLDHEIIDEIARRSGLSVEQAEHQDEQTSGSLAYMLDSITSSTPFHLNYSHLLQRTQPERPVWSQNIEQTYFHLTQLVIREMAETGNTVIIGRGAQFLLRGLPRTLHVYIYAPLPQRIANVMRIFNYSRTEATDFIEQRDGETANYLRHYYGSDGSQAELYHLHINTGLFSFETAASLIVQALPLARNIV